jgi:hypothetical protein
MIESGKPYDKAVEDENKLKCGVIFFLPQGELDVLASSKSCPTSLSDHPIRTAVVIISRIGPSLFRRFIASFFKICSLIFSDFYSL